MGEAVQMSLFDSGEKDWREVLSDTCRKLREELSLPERAVRLGEEKDKKGISSYSVCFYEAPWPTYEGQAEDSSRETEILHIKTVRRAKKEDQVEIQVRTELAETVGKLSGAEELGAAPGKQGIRFGFPESRMEEMLPELCRYVETLTRAAYLRYVPKTSAFACCSRYRACSEQGACVHPNTLYAKACRYRQNLEAGRIFYGSKREEKAGESSPV